MYGADSYFNGVGTPGNGTQTVPYYLVLAKS